MKVAQEVRFTIPGRPQRWMRPGQNTARGKSKFARYTDRKAEAHKKVVARIAREAFGYRAPWTGPVVVSIVAIFAIPSSWPKKVQQAAREARVMHTVDPDLDQIIKQVWDGVKGIVVADDNQFCGFSNPSAKRYGDPERTEVRLFLLEQQEDEITPSQRRLIKRQAQGPG